MIGFITHFGPAYFGPRYFGRHYFALPIPTDAERVVSPGYEDRSAAAFDSGLGGLPGRIVSPAAETRSVTVLSENRTIMAGPEPERD